MGGGGGSKGLSIKMVSKRSAGRSASILSYFSTEWGGGGGYSPIWAICRGIGYGFWRFSILK